ncbi:MAG: hypothetical protein PHG82_05715, partial [Candidatus Gracilibacteria bacterium]|nr:hypothetical protein [Candidatus Gracilibacteria bacterium]
MVFEFIKTFVDDIQKKALEKQEKLNNYVNSIDDEIVKKSSFIPIKRGGTNIKSHDLIIDNNGNYLFKVKGFFPIVFLAMFSIPLIATIITLLKDLSVGGLNIDFGSYIGQIIFSLLFLTPALILFYFLYRSYIFDFQNGYFYDTRLGKKLFELLNNEKYKTKIIPIKEIHSLQIVSERVHGKNTSYTSYELNIILKDSSRVNIIDHGNLEEIRKNASELSAKLGVKVYDLTSIYV